MTKFFKKFQKIPYFSGKALFSKNLAVMHNTTWVLNTMMSFRKKLKNQFQGNFRTEGRTDLIHMAFVTMARGTIRE